MKKLLKGIGFICIVAVIVLFLVLKGGGAGFGLGSGLESISTSDTKSTIESKNQDTEETSEKDTNIITVTIKENVVTVDGEVVKDKAELEKYIEDINDDNKKYELVQENAILSTYNWVKDIFDGLQIHIDEK